MHHVCTIIGKIQNENKQCNIHEGQKKTKLGEWPWVQWSHRRRVRKEERKIEGEREREREREREERERERERRGEG